MNTESFVSSTSSSSRVSPLFSDREYLREMGRHSTGEVSVTELERWLEYKLASVLSVEELEGVEDFALRCRRTIEGRRLFKVVPALD